MSLVYTLRHNPPRQQQEEEFQLAYNNRRGAPSLSATTEDNNNNLRQLHKYISFTRDWQEELILLNDVSFTKRVVKDLLVHHHGELLKRREHQVAEDSADWCTDHRKAPQQQQQLHTNNRQQVLPAGHLLVVPRLQNDPRDIVFVPDLQTCFYATKLREVQHLRKLEDMHHRRPLPRQRSLKVM